MTIERAVEVVVAWLHEHGQHDLAQAVAAATDPSPRARAKAAKIVRSMVASQMGSRTSPAKAAAARANGKKGGRPRTRPEDDDGAGTSDFPTSFEGKK